MITGFNLEKANLRMHTEDSFIFGSGGGENVSEYRDISELQVIR